MNGQNHGQTKKKIALTTRVIPLPTYTKGGTWMSKTGHSVTLCARAPRT